MKETLSKVKYFLPAEKMQSNLAIFLSIFALFFAVGNSNVPCLSADTCAVGSDEVFSGTVTIQNNTNYGVKLTGNPTANRTITFPDADGTVKLAGATLTANKILASDTNGEVSVTDKYPFTLGTAGQFLKVASTGTTVDFLTVGGLDSLTADAPYLSVNSSGAIDSSATLTASTPLKSSASGQITASDLDPTTDIAVGSATAGQILQVSTSSALEWADPSGGGGSFPAIASQNVVAGAVGLESNGQVRNIVTLQDGVNPIALGTLPNTTQSNYTMMHSQRGLYNSNADGFVYVYREFDSNQTNNCDTHLYVDVVYESSGSLQKWGRQCLSNEWSNHSGTNQPTTFESSDNFYSEDMIRIARYGDRYDDSIDNYVITYYSGSNNQMGQLYNVPFSIDTTTNTITVGTETLLTDRELCYQNQSCTTTKTTTNKVGNLFPMVWENANNRMVVFYNYINSNSWSSGYMGTKDFTCTGFGSSSASCSPNANWENQTYLPGTWTQYSSLVYPQIIYDKTASIFVALVNYSSNNQDCRANSFTYLQSGGISNQSYVLAIDTSGYTETNGDQSQPIASYSIYCSGNWRHSEPQYDSVNDLYLFSIPTNASYGSSYDYNMNYFFITADRTTPTNAPIVVAKYDLQNRLATLNGIVHGNYCANVTNEMCQDNGFGVFKNNTIFDSSNSKFSVFYRPLKDDNQCPNEQYSSTCMQILEFQMDNTTNTIDLSTLKTYEYFDGSNFYTTTTNEPPFLWLDAQGTIFSAQAFSNLQSGALQGMYSASAFVIPDNIASWIGHVTQSANSGSQVTVYSVGAVLDGLSGLTIGTEYYVKGDGTLGTTGTFKVGRAIATDKIYITNAR